MSKNSMKELLKEWKKFVEVQCELHNIVRNLEERQLNEKFGVVELTLENLLNQIITQSEN